MAISVTVLSNIYFVGQSKGPMSSAVLLKMLRRGVGVTANTMVWTVGMESWSTMRDAEPFRAEASLEGLSWHYVDAESMLQKGPVPSRLLVHYMEEGKLDGLSLVFHPVQNAWVQLGEVPELKQVMQTLAEEEDMRAALTNPVAESDQVYVDNDGEEIPAIPDDMHQKGLKIDKALPKRSFTADDGKCFVWDDAENDWVEDENPSGSEPSDNEDGSWKKKKQADASGTASDCLEADCDGPSAVDETEDEKAATRKRKKKKKSGSWKDNAAGLWVYVTGLPADVTVEELKAHFSKVIYASHK